MKYIIPYIPQSDNHYKGRQNVWEYRNDKKLWLELGQVYIRPRPKEPYKKAVVTIKYFFKTKARHDPDNYSGKFIMDCLTEYGVIQDDSFDCVKLIIEGGYDKNNPRTEVEVISGDTEEVEEFLQDLTKIEKDLMDIAREIGRKVDRNVKK